MILLNRIDAANKSSRAPRAGGAVSLAVMLCAVALAGCGGSSEEPGSRPAAPAGSSSTASAPSASNGAQAGAPTTTATAPAPATGVATQAAGAAPQDASQTGTRADAICVKRNHELKGAPLDAGSLSATASNASRRVAIERNALAELNALPPPPGRTNQWRMMIEQSKKALADVTKLADAARAGDAGKATRELAAAAKPRFRLLVAGADVGAKHCIQIG